MAIIVIEIVLYVIPGPFPAFSCLQSSSTLRIMMAAMLWRPRYQCLCVPTETNLKFTVSHVWGKAIFSPMRKIRSALNPMDYPVAGSKLLCIMILVYRTRHWAYPGHRAHIAHKLVLS
jgi:hypothetical protein